MASSLGISTRAYCKIENDETDLNFSRLQQIAEVYDMDTSDLVSFGEKISYHHSTHTGHNASIINQNDKELAEKCKALEIKLAVLEERNSRLEVENEFYKRILGERNK
jgi:transcriptional regulator with XRE-family HTH domain